MSPANQFLLALQAYQEVQAEMRQPEQTAVFVSPDPVLDDPLPAGTLLIGLAEDGQPLSFDLFEPATGPILVAGGGGCGKTAFLQALADATESDLDLQFGVLTAFPEEWHAQETLPGCLGIWNADHPAAGQFLERLISWAPVLPATRQAILLLIDGLDGMSLGSATRQAVRWLIARGPEAHILPVVSANAGRVTRLGSLQDYFHTRVLGHTRRGNSACLLGRHPEMDLADLTPGMQFYLEWEQGTLRFWTSPLEGVMT